jgi:hypothetical protein
MKKTIIMLSICVSFFFFSCHNKEKIKPKSTFVSLKDYRSDYEKKFSYEDSIAKSLKGSVVFQTFMCYDKTINDSTEIKTRSNKRVILFIENDTLKTKTNLLIGFEPENYSYFYGVGIKDPILLVDIRSFKEIN